MTFKGHSKDKLDTSNGRPWTYLHQEQMEEQIPSLWEQDYEQGKHPYKHVNMGSWIENLVDSNGSQMEVLSLGYQLG